MTGSRGRPAFASDDWMHEQQVRAELEAEAWRRLRKDLAAPEPQPAPAVPAPVAAPAAQPPIVEDPHYSGSTLLKSLVRFILGAFGGYLAWLAAIDSQSGEFESWLAAVSGFVVVLALSMFGPARRFVHFLAETMRWVIIAGIGLGAVWFVTHMSA